MDSVYLKLNQNAGKLEIAHGYVLDPRQEYIIDYDNEMEEQLRISMAVQMFRLPALNDYHTWLENNGFNSEIPNPTDKILSKFYGKKSLWKTELSQGIVVREIENGEYCIVMECSRLNTGFKYTQIILTFSSICDPGYNENVANNP